MKREKFNPRTIRLIGAVQRDAALAALTHAPIDPEHPLEILIREEKKTRRLDQNALMWVGPLADIADQAWVEGRRFSAEVWHEHFKREYLPEDDDPERGDLTKDGYRKYDVTPAGERVLVGSTTQLTVKGFARYLTQVEAEGASLGVQFSANPREMAA